ncbi:hypothetical protein WEI85_06515 [Actinomycetes bacterium KLBMP 9797]
MLGAAGVVNGDAPVSGPGSNAQARTRLYRDGACVLEDFPVADISKHLTDPTSVVWLDLCRPMPAIATSAVPVAWRWWRDRPFVS